MNKKLKILAHTIVNYSVKVQKGEKVLIIYETLEPRPLVKEIVKEIIKVGGEPYARVYDEEIDALIMENDNINIVNELKDQKQYDVDHYDVFIKISYNTNDYETKNKNEEIRKKLGAITKDIDNIRINERKWTILNYPSLLDAYRMKMKNDEFKEYALDVMNINYESMNEDIKPLKELMEKTDKVRIVSPDTELTFSIKGMKAIACTGTSNIPDGELYTAPLKESVNGYITFNTPSPYNGKVFNNVRLDFKDGKIVKATSSEGDEKINEILDTDEGARYIGEFSLGFNPKITKPMGDILYDEKIMGSLHFTPGQAYQESYNGNDSAIHWDMVLIQRKDYGGGEIYFDDVLIRKDGIFVLEELKPLNYDK